MNKISDLAGVKYPARNTQIDQITSDSHDYQISPSDEIRRKASFLSSLKAITRQPPPLQLSRKAASQPSSFDRLLLPHIARITGSETGDFAFAVAELAWRLEAVEEINADPNAIQGVAVLAKTARMYELLFVLRSGVEP